MNKEQKTIPFNDDSISLLLDVAKHEYDNEHNRTSVIDTKTSIALPIISAYFLALASHRGCPARRPGCPLRGWARGDGCSPPGRMAGVYG